MVCGRLPSFIYPFFRFLPITRPYADVSDRSRFHRSRCWFGIPAGFCRANRRLRYVLPNRLFIYLCRADSIRFAAQVSNPPVCGRDRRSRWTTARTTTSQVGLPACGVSQGYGFWFGGLPAGRGEHRVLGSVLGGRKRLGFWLYIESSVRVGLSHLILLSLLSCLVWSASPSDSLPPE